MTDKPSGIISIEPPPLPEKRSDSSFKKWVERRVMKRQEIKTELNFEDETNFYVGFTEDISVGGVFVVTWDIFPIGHHMILNFSLPGIKDPIRVEGVVRWVREHNTFDPDLWPGMGIQFKNLPGNLKDDIENFIKSRQPIFYED
jgi:uncharacterized protein (TIGR02266 family)